MLFHEQHFFSIHEQHKIKTEIFIRQHVLFQRHYYIDLETWTSVVLLQPMMSDCIFVVT